MNPFRISAASFAALALALAFTPGAIAAQSDAAAPQAAASAAVRPHAEAPMAQAVRILEPIRIDGRMDEEAWSRAVPVTEFVQLQPDEGRPASERTEIRILYDDQALYVGARMYDRHPVTTRLGRRDQWVPSDWLTVILDSYHDHRTAYGFEINPSGVRRDQSRDGGREDDSWDPVWEAAAAIDDDGWTAEMRIPFSQLRFNPADEQVWGLQIERQIARNGEFSVFSFTPTTQPGGIARFGHLHGLQGLRPGKRLEALPYVVARGENVDRAHNPFRDDRDFRGSMGVDVKYRLTSDLTVDATLNPDFGQVEVDPAQINLSAIETFFQERRPFFVEGSQIFNFGSGGANTMFYSRRIGRSPQLPVPSGSDQPDAARILAAAKLSGRTGAGWTVGVLNATTERVHATYSEAEGERATSVSEPFTNYFVGRLRRDFRAGQSAFGGMFTAVNRDLDSDLARSRLHGAAYTGGVDFRHEWAERTWTLNGFVSGSHVRGDDGALVRTQRNPWRYFQRPDADHLDLAPDATSLTGLSAEGVLNFRHGRHWRARAIAGTITPGYEINDIGFQRRADRIDTQVGGSYIENRPGRRLRQWNLDSYLRQEWNYGGDIVSRVAFLGGWAQTTNFWNVNLNFGTTLPGTYDDRLTRGGPIAERPSNWRVFSAVNSDWRKPVTGALGTYYEQGEGGAFVHELFTSVEVKPSPQLTFSAEPGLSRSYSRAQYRGAVPDETAAETFGSRYLFSDIRQTVLSVGTRANVTFTPNLSVQAFAQPFIASGDFGPVAEFAAPRTYDFLVYGVDRGEVEPVDGGVRVHPAGVGGPAASFVVPDDDFNFRSLRGSAVMRWEWRPGSTLFLAWQQHRSDFEPVGDFRFARDRVALWSARPDNVLVLKVNYWLNP